MELSYGPFYISRAVLAFLDQGHGLLESRTGNSLTTYKNEKIDALIFAVIDEITYFFFKRKVYYSAIDTGTF